jgi:hypothetical protein
MIYELTIEDSKEKQVIAFLKELDFVTLKKVTKSKTVKKKVAPTGHYDLPYFGVCPEWDVEAGDLRKTANKRLIKW